MTSEEEDDQEEEAPVRLMLVVLNEDAIQGFHNQVLVFFHASCTCIKQDLCIAVTQLGAVCSLHGKRHLRIARIHVACRLSSTLGVHGHEALTKLAGS